MRRDEESLFFWLEQNRLMEKMEADVKRGNALQQILEAERNNESGSSARVGTQQVQQAEVQDSGQMVFPTN